MAQDSKKLILFDLPSGPMLVNPAYISSIEYLFQEKVLKVYFGSSNEPRITLFGEDASTTFKVFVVTLAEPVEQEA